MTYQGEHDMIEIQLPWPPKELSPNFRGHWVPIFRAKKSYRAAARVLARKALRHVEGFNRFHGAIQLAYTFHPPAALRYDRDNLAARMKSGTDGIADALGMDDQGFHFAPPVLAEKVKGGMVRVTIVQLGDIA